MFNANAHYQKTVSALERVLAAPDPALGKILQAMGILLKGRAIELQQELYAAYHGIVQTGPFRGMVLPPDLPLRRLYHSTYQIGCYEQELHATLNALTAIPYQQIINIGSGIGYYTAGLARLFPQANIAAFDTQHECQCATQELVKANDCAARVRVGATLQADQFKDYNAAPTLVWCDIEGAEEELLDPDLAPQLYQMDFVVEVHECFKPGLLQLFKKRFSATHKILVIENIAQLYPIKKLLPNLELEVWDEFIAACEYRSGPTPWAVMIANERVDLCAGLFKANSTVSPKLSAF